LWDFTLPFWLVGWSGKLLPALTRTVILGSDSRGTHDHILLSDSGSHWKEHFIGFQMGIKRAICLYEVRSYSTFLRQLVAKKQDFDKLGSLL
jgi:hypothetical protein